MSCFNKLMLLVVFAITIGSCKSEDYSFTMVDQAPLDCIGLYYKVPDFFELDTIVNFIPPEVSRNTAQPCDGLNVWSFLGVSFLTQSNGHKVFVDGLGIERKPSSNFSINIRNYTEGFPLERTNIRRLAKDEYYDSDIISCRFLGEKMEFFAARSKGIRLGRNHYIMNLVYTDNQSIIELVYEVNTFESEYLYHVELFNQIISSFRGKKELMN